MKVCILLSFFVFLFCSLKAQSDLQKQRMKWEFAKWPQMFKDRALCLCLLEGYQDSSLKQRILSIDRSLYDPIGYVIFDSVLIPFIQKEADIININAKKSYGRISEAKAGKLVFNHCLGLYKSKSLNELLRKTSIDWYKIKDIDDIISKNMPAF